MSKEPESPPEMAPGIARDDPMIAAEWALGLLEGKELLAARGKQAIDPDFAWRKEWWDNWFAPLADEIAPAEPSGEVWQKIAATLAAPAQPAAEVVVLQARVKRWQWISAATAAAAAIAVMVGVLGTGIAPLPAPSATAPALASAPLVAAVPVGDGGLRVDVTFIPESGRLLVSAIGLAADGVHDHELWLAAPGGGAARSLGVIAPGIVRSAQLPAEVARELAAGSALVITREPLGGKQEGAAAGPVVAKGAFAPV